MDECTSHYGISVLLKKESVLIVRLDVERSPNHQTKITGWLSILAFILLKGSAIARIIPALSILSISAATLSIASNKNRLQI
jgi:hypothetical protein